MTTKCGFEAPIQPLFEDETHKGDETSRLTTLEYNDSGKGPNPIERHLGQTGINTKHTQE